MTTSPTFRNRITAFLNTGDQSLLTSTNERDWHRNFYWLDRSGLALPVAVAVESSAVPPAINDALQTRVQDNAKRMDVMLQFFDEVNTALIASGVRYCCVKGFSLIPQCFSNISERHQLDFDFLLSPLDVKRAAAAIETTGYRTLYSAPSGEVRLGKPWKKLLGVHAYLYDLPEPPPIELHTRVWEPEAAIDMTVPGSFLDTLEMHEIRGVQFPCLALPHQFIYLVLHIFRHLIGSWARLLSLYEVATLLRAHEGDNRPWKAVSDLVEQDPRLASVCALILGLVNVVFPAELPAPLRSLVARHLSAESALWLQEYASRWLLSDPAGTKLALLVEEQFCSDRQAWRKHLFQRLLPLHRPNALDEDSRDLPGKSLAYRIEEKLFQAGRVTHHLGRSAEYLLARIKWDRLRQSGAGPAQRTLREI